MLVSNRSLVIGGIVLALCGCGGGGNKESGPTPPTPAPTPTLLNRCPVLPASTATAGTLAAMVDGLVATEMRAAGLPGMTVSIAKDGTTLYAKGYGYADLNSCAPVQVTTEYQIGSVTKQFTAAAILQLHNAGMLDIDHTVVSYLPSYSFDSRITLRMLLNHTSGLYDYLNDDAEFPPPPNDWVNGVTQRYVLTEIANARLAFTPGSAYRYSNSGYYVLGSIIEVVTGDSYADYLTSHIFQPLGLNHTSMRQPLTAALPYTYDQPAVPGTQGLAVGIIPDQSIFFSAGALWSNVQDLATWDAALRNGAVIPPSLFTLMVTPAAVPDAQSNSPSTYAMGWVRGTISGHPIAYHGGLTFAYNSFNGQFLDDGFTVTALTNVDVQTDALGSFATNLIQSICSSASTASAC